MKELKEMFHRIGIWLLIVYMIGVAMGIYGCYRFNKWQIEESILLNGFVHNKQVYNVNIRP